MKRARIFGGLISMLVVALLVGVIIWWRWAILPMGGNKQQDFVIRKGEAITSIAKRLEKAKIIRSAWAFRLIIWRENWLSKIQAGRFKLNTDQGVESIAQDLTKGTQDIWITLPEGWRKEEAAARLAANLPKFNKNNFLLKAQEGYLFPDTYLVPQEANEDLVLKVFAANFTQKFTFKSESLTEREILILASLVEREAKKAVDRPIIAGILVKRWQNNWPLQVDATVQYAKANHEAASAKRQSVEWWPTVNKEDLKIKSLYNTYLKKGLPPEPICNPGLAAIEAVVTPQPTDFWYYITGKDGLMHYAETSQEQQENIRKFL
jgi:UPF0755 protein